MTISSKDLVVEFYEKYNNRDVEGAMAYIGDTYIQHNPWVADGPEAFRRFVTFCETTFRMAGMRSNGSSPTVILLRCTFIRYAFLAKKAVPSSTSSAPRTERSSSTGTWSKRSRGKSIRRSTTTVTSRPQGVRIAIPAPWRVWRP